MNIENLLEQFERKVSGIDKYFINDIIPSNSEIAFVLESPHIEEIKTKKPLSGDSGVNFSTQLFINEKKAFGKIPNKYNISIIESSPFPLQLSAYSSLIETIYDDVDKMLFLSNLCCLKCTLENLPDEQSKTQLINFVKTLPTYIIEDNIYKNFECRIKNLIESKPKVIVLCGLFAQQFFNSYLSTNGIMIIGKSQNYIGKIEIDSDTIIELIYINHPKDWHTNYYPFNSYVKPKLVYIKSKLT